MRQGILFPRLVSESVQFAADGLDEGIAVRPVLGDELFQIIYQDHARLLGQSLLEYLPDSGEFVKRFYPVDLSPVCAGNALENKGLARAVAAVDDEAAGPAALDVREVEGPGEASEKGIDGLDLGTEPGDIFQDEIASALRGASGASGACVLVARFEDSDCRGIELDLGQ